MKPTGRFPNPKFIRTVSSVVIAAVGFTTTILLAQDNHDALRQAAEQGDSEAQFLLGGIYANGEGEFKDDAEAVHWFRKSAEQGDASAQFTLGVMYVTGRGVPKDFVLGHMWTNIAAANGFKVARGLRDSLERDMTRDEISRATELARACMSSDYQDCQQ